jgi:hypothetical protein
VFLPELSEITQSLFPRFMEGPYLQTAVKIISKSQRFFKKKILKSLYFLLFFVIFALRYLESFGGRGQGPRTHQRGRLTNVDPELCYLGKNTKQAGLSSLLCALLRFPYRQLIW